MTETMLSELLVFAGLMSLLATLGAVTITLIKRRPIKSSPSSVSLDQIAQRLATLQDTVDGTAIEVERIGEAQRFTTKLLSERPLVAEPPRVAAKVNTPH